MLNNISYFRNSDLKAKILYERYKKIFLLVSRLLFFTCNNENDRGY